MSGEAEPCPRGLGEAESSPQGSGEVEPTLWGRARCGQPLVVWTRSVVALLSIRKHQRLMVISSTSLGTPVLHPRHRCSTFWFHGLAPSALRSAAAAVRLLPQPGVTAPTDRPLPVATRLVVRLVPCMRAEQLSKLPLLDLDLKLILIQNFQFPISLRRRSPAGVPRWQSRNSGIGRVKGFLLFIFEFFANFDSKF